MLFSVKMRWFNATVQVAEGYQTREDAESMIEVFRRQWNVRDNPFFVVGEPEPAEATAADENPDENDDEPPINSMFR